MDSSNVYEVRLHVTEHNLGTVLSALAGSSTLVSVIPTQESASKPHPKAHAHPKATSRFVGGQRDKGISGEELVMETLQKTNRIFTAHEISNVFVNRGFAGNSASPVLSRLIKAGKVRALGSGKYCLPGALLHMGASAHAG